MFSHAGLAKVSEVPQAETTKRPARRITLIGRFFFLSPVHLSPAHLLYRG